MTKAISYDMFSGTLTMTESYKRKTERYGSPEYKELCKYMQTYPGLKIEIIKKLPSSKKTEEKKVQTAPSLTYKQMIEYMMNFGEQSAALKKEFDAIRKLSCIQANPYRYVRNWFDKKFANVEVDENGNLILNAVKEEKTAAAETNKIVEMPTQIEEATA